MELRRFESAQEFYRQAEPFLVAREAMHCLMLGISSGLLQDPERTPNPYLALVEEQGRVLGAALRTPPYNVVLSLQDDPGTLSLFAQHLLASGGAPGVVGPAEVSRAFAAEWAALTGSSYQPGLFTRSYMLERIRPPLGVSGRMRLATPADRELLIAWMAAFHAEALGHSHPAAVDRAATERAVDSFLGSSTSGLVFWLDPEPVSMAGFSGPTPHGIRIVTVYTPPRLRGQGYASACVATLSELMLDLGRRFCFLFTDRTNSTANKIYQQIGYEPVCEYEEYRFEGPGDREQGQGTGARS